MMEKEICWNITARCNQRCKYCHRFLNVKELSFEENSKILNDLIGSGITDITWTGGEALILEYLDKLLKISYENGIKNKLITNGKLLTNEKIDEIGKYLDSITLSIDSVNNDINEELGRGFEHYENVKRILDYLKEKHPNIKIRINSVISSYTKDVEPLIDFLNNYEIYSWRLFKFMPLRELAVINREKFSISMDEYKEAIEKITKNSKNRNIDTRIEEDMEKKYVLILADGSIIITNDGKDENVGNALTDSLIKFI